MTIICGQVTTVYKGQFSGLITLTLLLIKIFDIDIKLFLRLIEAVSTYEHCSYVAAVKPFCNLI